MARLAGSADPHADALRAGPWFDRACPELAEGLTTNGLSRLTTNGLSQSFPSQYARQFPEQRAVDGERFPQLSELFDLGKGELPRFNIETKITPTSGPDTPDPATFAKLVVAAVRAADVAKRVTVQSFDWCTLIRSIESRKRLLKNKIG